MGTRATVGEGARVGSWALVGDGARAVLLSSFNKYGWVLYVAHDGTLRFAFGCEDHPLARWTVRARYRMSKEHGHSADRARDIALTAAREAAREHRKGMTS